MDQYKCSVANFEQFQDYFISFISASITKTISLSDIEKWKDDMELFI